MSESQVTPTQPAPPPAPCAPPKKRSWGGKVLRTLGIVILALSILLNVELLVLLAATSEWGLSRTILRDGKKDQVVAVYTVEGMIDDDTADDFQRFYYAVRDDSNVKAVVVRVNSPGGGVSASDGIYRMIDSIRTSLRRPVVVSMGGLAASGGYYVSMGADKIYAEPTTVTGSVGVIAMWPVFKDFLNKHGVEVVTIRSDQARLWKAKPNPVETPEERVLQEVRAMLTALDDRFIEVVKKGRGDRLKTRQVAAAETQPADAGEGAADKVEIEPLNGKVYLAQQAMDFGMVDRIGYLSEAVSDAAETAGLDRPKVVSYSRRAGLVSRLLRASDSQPPVDAKLIDKLMTPRIMMMWKVQ